MQSFSILISDEEKMAVAQELFINQQALTVDKVEQVNKKARLIVGRD